jgi:uncharacterized membrane protein
MMWHGYGLWNFGWIGMVLLWAFVIGLALLVIWALTGNNRRSGVESKEIQPFQVLKMRLAAGEISVDEYRTICQELSQNGVI